MGDEHGMVHVLKYAAEDENLVKMAYHISPDYLLGDFLALYFYMLYD